MSTRRRAFTLIEMTVLSGVLLIIASLVLPNAFRLRDSMRVLTTQAQIERFLSSARIEASRSGKTVIVRSEGTSLVMEQSVTGPDNEQLQTLDLDGPLNVASIKASDSDLTQPSTTTNTDSWSAYADGMCDPSDFTFDTDTSDTKILRMTSKGRATWYFLNTLPEADMTDGKWDAGEWVPDNAQ